jgi:uncharacterized protein (DUF1684 family)
MLPRSVAARLTIASLALASLAKGQEPTPPTDAVRVTVSINADGSKTVYEFDSLHHKATATTTGKNGQLMGKIRYVLDDAGRFSSGEVYGPDDQFRFRTLYKYDSAGKILQETQLGKDDAVRNKIVYAYDKVGRQTAYTVYDAAGKVIRTMPEKTSPRPTPPSRRTR